MPPPRFERGGRSRERRGPSACQELGTPLPHSATLVEPTSSSEASFAFRLGLNLRDAGGHDTCADAPRTTTTVDGAGLEPYPSARHSRSGNESPRVARKLGDHDEDEGNGQRAHESAPNFCRLSRARPLQTGLRYAPHNSPEAGCRAAPEDVRSEFEKLASKAPSPIPSGRGTTCAQRIPVPRWSALCL